MNNSKRTIQNKQHIKTQSARINVAMRERQIHTNNKTITPRKNKGR